MENILLFNSKGFNDYKSWQQDKKNLKRINELIRSIQRDGPLQGIGKPEVLKNKKGVYSRRIDEKNRLEYTFTSDDETTRTLIIVCGGHYESAGSVQQKNLLKNLEI